MRYFARIFLVPNRQYWSGWEFPLRCSPDIHSYEFIERSASLLWQKCSMEKIKGEKLHKQHSMLSGGWDGWSETRFCVCQKGFYTNRRVLHSRDNWQMPKRGKRFRNDIQRMRCEDRSTVDLSQFEAHMSDASNRNASLTLYSIPRRLPELIVNAWHGFLEQAREVLSQMISNNQLVWSNS